MLTLAFFDGPVHSLSEVYELVLLRPNFAGVCAADPFYSVKILLQIIEK